MKFSDIIYGEFETPNWLDPFITIPEFVRLRGVRLSNVDSIEFKDLNGPNRWEHSIGVAYLALNYSNIKNLSLKDTVHLTLAALLHDIATPPFAHTVEYILESFSHEIESNRLLQEVESTDSHPNMPVFESQAPQFIKVCEQVSKKLKIKIDPEEVASLIVGESENGYLINGSIDLDNIDNVTRASMFMGIDVDKKIPLHLVKWLSDHQSIPIRIYESDNSAVKSWLDYKFIMYSKFYNSSEIEIGRQAFLQHLIRRVYKEGLSRKNIIWKTDEQLLRIIESYNNYSELGLYQSSLQELAQRYRLLESTEKLYSFGLGENELKVLKNPIAATWIEEQLSTKSLELFVIVQSKRFPQKNQLFETNFGSISIFKLGQAPINYSQLPDFIQKRVRKAQGEKFNHLVFKRILDEFLNSWVDKKPWLELTHERKVNLKSNLENIGNWSFRLSRNRSLHTYPATFVQNIPATLISCLGLKGELIVDVFGGTGNTAIEAIKQDCSAVSIDANKIASLISKVRTSYISNENHELLNSINLDKISKFKKSSIPDVANINKWHHTKTLDELRKIRTFISSIENNEVIRNFLLVSFSGILTSTTARKGKQHGFFADNTPLAKGVSSPDYEPAITLFISRIKKNLEIVKRDYIIFERQGKKVIEEFAKCEIINDNSLELDLKSFGIQKNSVSAIITSPPYLCMVDYTLGQRLSYCWLFPELMEENFENEIGARRTRTNPETAYKEYMIAMRKFAEKSKEMLKIGGFLCTVIGESQAKAFKDRRVIESIDSILSENGFELFWFIKRPINWHRNHSYASLKEERVAVHIKLE